MSYDPDSRDIDDGNFPENHLKGLKLKAFFGKGETLSTHVRRLNKIIPVANPSLAINLAVDKSVNWVCLKRISWTRYYFRPGV
jgi:hypothetical protein